MWKVIVFCFILSTMASASGHQNKLQGAQSDADLQSELMPQELNPAFTSDKVPTFRGIFRRMIQDTPWRAFLPLPRTRRNAEEPVLTPVYNLAEQIKGYSRILACVVLVLSAVVEIVVYVIEAY